MRPYLAIIKDSFRAALANKVLYVLLFLITFLLLAIGPFHYQETLDWKLDVERNIQSPYLMFERLVDRHDDEGEEVVKHVWDKLAASTQKDLTSFVKDFRANEEGKEDAEETGDTQPPEQESGGTVEVQVGGNSRSRDQNEMFFREINLAQQVARELNDVIQTRDFYDAAVWEGRALDSEAQELIDEGVESLSDERSRRLNRLLIGQAVSPTIQSGPATSLDFYYLWWKAGWLSTNQTHSQFKNVISSQIPYYFDKFVLSIGLIIAILVTANMIPETFEPGSLNLLLSKPIYRWALLLAKFIGGCAFVALCAGYLFFGVWLWLGLGLGIWDPAILLSIPIYILVFAIYYSVSTFIGVWFRSPIVSVIMTALFWAFCFGIGTLYAFIDTYMHNSELVKPVAVGDRAIAVDLAHQFVGWDSETDTWKDQRPATDNPEEQVAAGIIKFMSKLDRPPEPILPPTVGPMFNPKTNQVLLGSISFGDPSSMGRAGLTLLDMETLSAKKVGSLPSGAVALLKDDQGPIVVDSSGRFMRVDLAKSKLPPKPEEVEKEPEPKPRRRGPNRGKPMKSISDWFENIGPDKVQTVRGPGYVAANDSANEIAIFYQLGVFVYRREASGKYELDRQVELDVELPVSMSGQIAYSGKTIMVVLGNGQIVTLDSDSLSEKDAYQPETRSAFREIASSENGRWFAINYRNGNLWMLDTEDDERMFRPRVTGQGDISGITFENDSSIWVCDRTDRITKYSLESFSKEQQFAPPGDIMKAPFMFSYRYMIEPFYKICPKPGEFYKLVTHLSNSSDAKSNKEVDLRQIVEDRNPWSPFWSGLGFMCLMLFLSCMMFHFGDY